MSYFSCNIYLSCAWIIKMRYISSFDVIFQYFTAVGTCFVLLRLLSTVYFNYIFASEAKRSPFYSHICDLKNEPARHWRSFTVYVSEIVKDRNVSRFWLESLIVWRYWDIWHVRKFRQFQILTISYSDNFIFCRFLRKYPSKSTLFYVKNIYFVCMKINF